MYKYIHNNKYQMKYSKFAKHSEDRKQLEDNINAERSKAENFFWKLIINCILGLPNLGIQGEFLVATKFFQVACHFSMIFIKFYKISWYFQVFQVYSHFSRFSRSSGNPGNVYKWPQQRTKAYASDVFLDCERLLTTVRLCAPTAWRWGEKRTLGIWR